MTGYPVILGGDHAQYEIDNANTPPKERSDWPLPSFDATDWAEAFCKIATDLGYKDAEGKPIDEGWMIGWFANSLMRGFDEHGARSAKAESELRKAFLTLLVNTPNFLMNNAPHVCKARELLRDELAGIYGRH